MAAKQQNYTSSKGRTRIFNTSTGPAATKRREKTLAKLTEQLVNKTKMDKVSQVYVPLTDADIQRIEKEIGVLKHRIGYTAHLPSEVE